MDIDEMKSAWQAYDSRLEASLKLNVFQVGIIQSQKVKNKLQPLLWQRVAEIMLHFIAIRWLVIFLIKHFNEIKFVAAAACILLFFAIAFINCFKQIMLLTEIDYSKDIVTIQKKITLLQSHILDYIRLTFLCIPTYLAYPVIAFKALGNFDISKINEKWWTANLVFTILIIPVCLWLYQQVSYKNIHKNWVRYIIQNAAGTRVSKAMEFIKEMDELKK